MYLSRLLSKIFVGSKQIDSSRQSIEKQNANELDHYLYFCSKKRYFPYVWICLQMLYPMFTFLSQQSFHICCLDFFNEVIHSVKVRIHLKSSWKFFESFLYCNTLEKTSQSAPLQTASTNRPKVWHAFHFPELFFFNIKMVQKKFISCWAFYQPTHS